jgi:integrase
LYRRSRAIIGRDKIAGRIARTVTMGHVEELLQNARQENGRLYSTSMLKKVRGHLGMAYDFGIRRGYATENPARGAEMPGNAVRPGKPTWLDADQFGIMRAHLNSARSVPNVALLTMLLTGMRPGETLALSWDVVDLDAGTIEVKRSVQQSQNGRVRTVVDHLKGHADPRLVVGLPADLVAALRELRRDHPFKFLFPDETGKAPLRFEGLRWHCEKACLAVGIAPVSPHKLRHTLGSMMLEAGENPANIADHLGHSLEVFLDTYGHPMKRLSVSNLIGDGTNG